MPIFLYVHPETNKIIEEVFPCRKAPDSITLPDGTVCERCLAAEIASQGGANPACWPMYSQALAVHPSQRKEFEEFADKHGVTTEFDARGRPKFESKSHRKRYCELVGATDFDGGYGDPRCD
jgi:hypothetical protein